MSIAEVPKASDLIDFLVNKGNGVKGLSQMGLEIVPQKFIQPHEERLDFTQIVSSESIPIIDDFSTSDDPKGCRIDCDAAEKWGFFQIINHGIPVEVLEDVIEAGHKFFELPVEERRKVYDSDDDENTKLWPAVSNPELTAGAGRHADVSSITMLLQDDVGGLYVREPKGDGWIHVPPVKGALVINIGDVLQIMSNDRYKSVEHRVIVNGSRNRVSVPIFVNPAPDAVFGPLTQVLKWRNHCISRLFLYSDYFTVFQ
ncbi:hypothetical protein HAX54_052793 [Datura stramonium]|uniref:Fe2OG dioxygenase domain-containing protein n=1 Tax=Datura stramonium TaxID=4076 RepID=A0ABS8WNT3_DATST|nr:hypothetical protein [Datura stramonium]